MAAPTWITLAEADVLTVLSGPELAGYRAAALADAQADPVQPTLDDVTGDVRGYVAACNKNTLGPDGTIPARLKSAALDLVAVRIPSRVGRSPKPGRKELAEQAIEKLKAVAACKFGIADPQPDQLPVSDETPAAPAPSISSPRRHRDRC